MSELTPAAQAAAELVANAARLAEAPDEGEQPQPTTEAAPVLPSLEADLTGIEDILDEPPEDDTVEDDEPPVEEDTSYDYDPNQLQAKLKKLEKQNAWLEEQRLTQGRKNWKAEAERRFPLADTDEIQATSRRSFLKAAAGSHERYARKMKPILDQLKQAETEEQEQIQAEQRETEAGKWGRPTGGPQQPLVEQAGSEKQKALDRRNHTNVRDMVAARFQHDDRYKDGI